MRDWKIREQEMYGTPRVAYVVVFGWVHPCGHFGGHGPISWIVQRGPESPGGATSGLPVCLERPACRKPRLASALLLLVACVCVLVVCHLAGLFS